MVAGTDGPADVSAPGDESAADDGLDLGASLRWEAPDSPAVSASAAAETLEFAVEQLETLEFAEEPEAAEEPEPAEEPEAVEEPEAAEDPEAAEVGATADPTPTVDAGPAADPEVDGADEIRPSFDLADADDRFADPETPGSHLGE